MSDRPLIMQRTAFRKVHVVRNRFAFTLIELLVVISIIGILITILGVAVTTTLRKAREAATVALIQKIDGLLDERLKGFERATKSRDFERIIQLQTQSLEASGIFGVRKSVIAAIARKNNFRQYFPQRYEDLARLVSSGPLAGVPLVFVGEDVNGNQVLDSGEDTNGNGVLDVPQPRYDHTRHNRETESSAILYYSLTKMDAFGVPPVGESEFGTNEVRDTDGDGLLEFVDGWGRPLRFYRWPTRLIKPNGVFGPDGQPGVAGTDDDGNGVTDDAWEIGWPGSDDYRALNPINIASPAVASDPNTPYHLPRRDLAGLLIDGLPRAPARYSSGGNQLRYRYDTIDEDPDDPYGLIVLDMRRLATTINVLAVGGYPEGIFPTLDTYHAPLVVSAGADGVLGLHEPYLLAPNAGGVMQYGVLAQPIFTSPNPNDIPTSTFDALTDNLTNRNRRAGKGK